MRSCVSDLDVAITQAVIFCNTKRKGMYVYIRVCTCMYVYVYMCVLVDWLTEKMRDANFTVSSMHGACVHVYMFVHIHIYIYVYI